MWRPEPGRGSFSRTVYTGGKAKGYGVRPRHILPHPVSALTPVHTACRTLKG